MGRVAMGLRSGTGLFALVVGSAAAAQSTLPPPDAPETPAAVSEPAPGGEIVVTGSRIRRDPLSQEQPIVFVSEEDIAKTGLNSVSDVLQRLPSSGGGLNSKINNSGNLGNPPDGGGVGAGAAEIDLRYLTSRRVLVLVDGIRYVNATSASGVPGSVDLNTIPESAIERIEVLQDGASAIYGSDAIAGVVNIITKKRQAGFDASAQIGQYDEGDGFTQNYQLSWGNGGDGPLQVVVGGNYVKQNAVSTDDRDLARFPVPYSDTCLDGQCSGFIPNGRFQITNLAGGVVQTLVAPELDGTAPELSDFRAFQDPGDRFNFGPFNYLQVPLERYGVFANAKYEVSSDINLSFKGIWNKRKSKNQAAPLPFGVGPTSGLTPALSAINIHATNPFNPFGVDLVGDNPLTPAAADGNLRAIFRRYVEGGPRRFHQTVDTWYGTATLDGKFDLGGRNWFWDVNAAYGRNKASQKMFGNIHAGRLAQALGPVASCTAPCVPFNLFGGAGSITQQMIDFVAFVQKDSSKQSIWDFTGNLSGSLFDLPGGPLGLAVGVEYRDLSGRFDPDPVVQQGLSSDIPASATGGGYDVKEIYGELSAPLLADRFFADLIELTGAVRYSKYKLDTGESFSATTFKAGLNWKPVPDLRLRASWAEGFRAPQIGEFFGTQTRFDQNLNDPCSVHATNTQPQRYSNNESVRANCHALGVPVGGYIQANPQISVATGGNLALSPETSRSWVLGAVLAPSYLPGFSIEGNWYDIKIEDAIQSINANTTVVNCVVQNDPAACALTTRTAGELLEVSGLLQNIAAIKTRGFDFNVAYRNLRTGFGTFGLTWNNSFLTNYDVYVPALGGVQKISREGTEQGAPSQAFPKWKAIGIVDWDLANFGATLTGRYVSAVRDTLGLPGDKLDSVFYTDAQLRWMPGFIDDLGLAVGVNNLFDVKAPGCFGCETNNLAVSIHDVPGRYLYARINFKM